jgi:hypothetical protein
MDKPIHLFPSSSSSSNLAVTDAASTAAIRGGLMMHWC